LLILKTYLNSQKNYFVRPDGSFWSMGRLHSDAESFFNHGSSVRQSIELIGKTAEEIFGQQRCPARYR
jgi:hypothetical protein